MTFALATPICEARPAARFLRLSGFLGPAASAHIRAFALGRSRELEQAAGGLARAPRVVAWDVDALAPHLVWWLRRETPSLARSLRVPLTSLGKIETQLAISRADDSLPQHIDCDRPETKSRRISFVYYAHAEPRLFDGGELVLHDPAGRMTVLDPEGDSLVVFPSNVLHEVRPVRLRSDAAEDGRVTLNGWICEGAGEAGSHQLSAFSEEEKRRR